MWEYQKQLEYPIRIRRPDARAAKVIMSQYGGPNCVLCQTNKLNVNRAFSLFVFGYISL